jgi:hypothetical protein
LWTDEDRFYAQLCSATIDEAGAEVSIGRCVLVLIVTRLNSPRVVTPQSIKTFARTARKRMRTDDGGYRRDYLRALAQRVEVDAKELRIMGSKSELLRTLVPASSATTTGFGVPSFVPKWRTRHDSNV